MTQPLTVTDQQIQKLIDGIRASTPAPSSAPPAPQVMGTKVEKFSSGNPTEWITWREAFEQAAAINGWSNARQRREIKKAMSGTAAGNVRDIDIEVEGLPASAVADAKYLLDKYETVFLPPGGTKMAKRSFHDAAQKETETIQAWHSRLRRLHARAFPTMTSAEAMRDSHLTEKFVRGLANIKVMEFTDYMMDDTTPYPEVLKIAMRHAATRAAHTGNASKEVGIRLELEGGEAGTPGADVSSIQAGPAGQNDGVDAITGNCFFCDAPGHARSDCALWKKALRQIKGDRDGRGGGRGGRGNRRGRGGPRGGRGGPARGGQTRLRGGVSKSGRSGTADMRHRINAMVQDLVRMEREEQEAACNKGTENNEVEDYGEEPGNF